MHLFVNGNPAEIAEGTTVADLLADKGYAGRRVAVELNGEIVPRSQHADRKLADGDRIEIVHAIGGGALTSAQESGEA